MVETFATIETHDEIVDWVKARTIGSPALSLELGDLKEMRYYNGMVLRLPARMG